MGYKMAWATPTDFYGESSKPLSYADAFAYAKKSAKDNPSFGHFVLPFSAPEIGTTEFEVWCANKIMSGNLKAVDDEKIMVVR